MQLLQPSTQNYAWGSRELISGLRGEEPSAHPEAELWYGAHPGAATHLADGSATLAEYIEEDPEGQLGRRCRNEFGDSLPFLLKILAAGAPLSLQAHPSKSQAEEGYARENDLGIALSASNRNYKDDNHKPELLVALTEFHAMAGFRPLDKTLEMLRAIDCAELDRYLGMLDEEGAEEDNLRALFTTWITIPSTARHSLIDAVDAAIRKRLPKLEGTWMYGPLANILDLNDRYPGDVGVLGALLLNYIVLQPGQAIYLDAGNLHAYVKGLGVEIMANSDNVLRGGLTSKYVDVAELVRVLKFRSLANPVVKVNDGHYEVPINEFDLRRVDIDGPRSIDHDGPVIVLVTEGAISAGSQALGPTQAVWVSADEPAVTLDGKGTAFIATV
ncbi:mannose-6-phosphate isomerase, class I [Corynebacterium vitaeruminis]|uniref:mannose-6-phosphate isomerase, class I n=1 Tax=Corynebacterium vitaeruminis TaxID=38305 RepID=UPI0023F1FC14|nr:mannose-6-phosphate isomerase, class I [Corynebacterium vitaeruminis]